MRRRPIVVALILAGFATVGAPTHGSTSERTLITSAVPALPPAQPAYWKQRGCRHGHPSKVAYRAVSRITRSIKPLTKRRVRRARHYVRCVKTAAKSRAVRRAWKKGLAKRRANRWYYVFKRMPQDEQGWARNTGGCEGGNDPGKHDLATGYTYHGTFQFLLSTARKAGFTTDPHNTSWHEQAVRAIRWKWIAGRSQWPVCG